MNDGIIASLILGISFWGIVSIIKSIADYKVLKKIVETCKTDVQLNDIVLSGFSNRILNLKWGIIILLGGLGLILIHFLGLNPDTPLSYGIESVFIASGFLLYFFIEKSSNVKSKNLQS